MGRGECFVGLRKFSEAELFSMELGMKVYFRKYNAREPIQILLSSEDLFCNLSDIRYELALIQG